MIKISVIIPCLNEQFYISDCLNSILNNGFDLKYLEILVVDGGSTDNTLSILNKLQNQYNQIRVIHNTKKKTPFALNLGIENAKHPYLLIAGAHAVYPKGYIRGLSELIIENNIDIVGGSLTTCVKNSNRKSEAIKFVLTNKWGVGNSTFRVGTNELTEVDTVPFGLYPKSIFENAGYYNEKLIRNHDIELSKRIKQLGYHIWLTPKYKVNYFARDSYLSLAKNNYGNGFWNAKTLLITRNFNALSLRHYIPLGFLSALILPLILALTFHNFFAFVSIIILAFYLFFLRLVYLKNAKTLNIWYVLYAFIVLHFSYGFGTLMGFLNGLMPSKN